MASYTLQQASNPKLKDCVEPTPFYDSSSNMCVQCPKDYPYFSLETNKCQNCGDGTYSKSTLSCEKTIATTDTLDYNPTLSRLVMNIL